MGHSASHLATDTGLRPGTYCIVSAVTGTIMQVSDHDHAKVVAWERHEGESQMWFLQRSGGGYIFKNRQHGSYLAVAGNNFFTLLYASRYPTTWVLLKSDDCYLIKFGDNNGLLDLHFGSGNNGNEIHLLPANGNANKRWRLERVSDDTGEVLPESYRAEAARLHSDLIAQTEKLTLKEQEISRYRDTIRQLQRELQTRQYQQQGETGGLEAQMDRVEHLVTQMMNGDSRPPGGYNMA